MGDIRGSWYNVMSYFGSYAFCCITRAVELKIGCGARPHARAPQVRTSARQTLRAWVLKLAFVHKKHIRYIFTTAMGNLMADSDSISERFS